jgi:hypothetical protein
MYLSKTALKSYQTPSFLGYLIRRQFATAAKEYDLAVIGGGPGGMFKAF